MAPPLHGVKVLELAGLAPAPFCGMVLADFGADVVRVDRAGASGSPDFLARGKRSIALDMKHAEGKRTLLALAQQFDVLLEPFRPGVMEGLGLGPDVLLKANPRLIYARLTGWGQTGDKAVVHTAGHDINYIALSGLLSTFRHKGERPLPPTNLLGDFAGGGLMCALGILLALIERERSGRGQVVDAAMVDGAAYLGSFTFMLREKGAYDASLAGVGTNLLDTGAPFYDTYRCADGHYLSVGAIEPQFYAAFLKGLGLDEKRDGLPHQMDRSKWPQLAERFARQIATRPRDAWAETFAGTDACVWPVLGLDEAPAHEHNRSRGTFPEDNRLGPAAAPRLSRTPALPPRPLPFPGEHSLAVLREAGLDDAAIGDLLAHRAVTHARSSKL